MTTPTRTELLATRLGEHPEYHLHPRCQTESCTRVVALSCRYLARVYGTAATLGEVVSRLRCKGCDAAPARVLVTDRYALAPENGHDDGVTPMPDWVVEITSNRG